MENNSIRDSISSIRFGARNEDTLNKLVDSLDNNSIDLLEKARDRDATSKTMLTLNIQRIASRKGARDAQAKLRAKYETSKKL